MHVGTKLFFLILNLLPQFDRGLPLICQRKLDMSKLTSLYRQLEIIKLAKKGPFDWDQLVVRLEVKSVDLDLRTSKRTLNRDLKEIKELFGLVITFNFKTAKYILDKEESSENHLELLESFETIQAFGRARKLSGKVFFEQRTARGTEFLKSILEAIEDQNSISIIYEKFWTQSQVKRIIRPIALKEYLHRWYVLGWNENNELRFFGLDRIHSLEITQGKKIFPKPPNLEERFLQTIGIINEPNDQIETVLLTFTRFKGQYILSMPLHPTQEIIEETEDTVQVSLRVKLNYELISIILSHGNEVRVDSPERLKNLVFAKAEDILKGNLNF